MGNYFSHNQPNNHKCALCTVTLDNNTFTYLDVVCNNCEERFKGYYHSECLKKLNIDDKIHCPQCNIHFRASMP